MIIELPWPSSKLSPNAPVAWREKILIKKKYKRDCKMLSMGKKISGDKIPVKITFHPPDNRKRDIDNMLASIKYGIDGMCEALGIDDNVLRPMTLDVGEKVKHGKIVIAF